MVLYCHLIENKNWLQLKDKRKECKLWKEKNFISSIHIRNQNLYNQKNNIILDPNSKMFRPSTYETGIVLELGYIVYRCSLVATI